VDWGNRGKEMNAGVGGRKSVLSAKGRKKHVCREKGHKGESGKKTKKGEQGKEVRQTAHGWRGRTKSIWNNSLREKKTV